MNGFFGVGTRTRRHVSTSRRVSTSRQQNSEVKRELMPDDWHFPCLRAECLDVVDIEGIRTIIWGLDGKVYHQDCTTPHHSGSVGKSYFYLIK